MLDYILNNEEIILDFIKDANISPKDLPLFYKAVFEKHSNKVKTKFIFSIIENPFLFSKKLLSKYLNISEKDAEIIVNNSIKKAFFPISDGTESDVISIYIIESDSFDDNIIINTSEDIKNSIKIVSDYFNKKFFVFFDKDFSGNSFLLAFAAAILLEKETLEKYAFTGEINFNGNIKNVQNIREKKQICEENNLDLITPDRIEHIEDLKLLEKENVDIPFVQLFGKDKTAYDNNLNFFEKE
jgi:hypothetical protein